MLGPAAVWPAAGVGAGELSGCDGGAAGELMTAVKLPALSPNILSFTPK